MPLAIVRRTCKFAQSGQKCNTRNLSGLMENQHEHKTIDPKPDDFNIETESPNLKSVGQVSTTTAHNPEGHTQIVDTGNPGYTKQELQRSIPLLATVLCHL